MLLIPGYSIRVHNQTARCGNPHGGGIADKTAVGFRETRSGVESSQFYARLRHVAIGSRCDKQLHEKTEMHIAIHGG